MNDLHHGQRAGVFLSVAFTASPRALRSRRRMPMRNGGYRSTAKPSRA